MSHSLQAYIGTSMQYAAQVKQFITLTVRCLMLGWLCRSDPVEEALSIQSSRRISVTR